MAVTNEWMKLWNPRNRCEKLRKKHPSLKKTNKKKAQWKTVIEAQDQKMFLPWRHHPLLWTALLKQKQPVLLCNNKKLQILRHATVSDKGFGKNNLPSKRQKRRGEANGPWPPQVKQFLYRCRHGVTLWWQCVFIDFLGTSNLSWTTILSYAMYWYKRAQVG